MGKKKVNPRRIPLPKNAVDKDAIIEEAMKDDMSHGWLLVASALSDLGYDNISELSDAVNRFIETGSALDDETKNIQGKAAWSSKEHRDAEIRRARSILGIPNTPLNADKVKSPVELKAFKKKVQKVALQVALSVIYLGLKGTGRFSEDELKKIFFSADLTMAEIESGTNSFENIEKELLNRMVKFELAKVNTTGTIPSWYRKVNDMIKHNRKSYRLDRIERVEKYERLFDEAAISHDPEKLRLLDAYYTSGEWREDYEADERGELPSDLKRGVLSQDALYELLEKAEL